MPQYLVQVRLAHPPTSHIVAFFNGVDTQFRDRTQAPCIWECIGRVEFVPDEINTGGHGSTIDQMLPHQGRVSNGLVERYLFRSYALSEASWSIVLLLGRHYETRIPRQIPLSCFTRKQFGILKS